MRENIADEPTTTATIADAIAKRKAMPWDKPFCTLVFPLPLFLAEESHAFVP
jgi:hypothetical protein